MENAGDIKNNAATNSDPHAAELHMQSIIENAPFGAHMYELFPDGRLIFTGANPAANRILGMQHHPLFGLEIEEAFSALVDTEIPDAYRKVAATGEVFSKDYVNYTEGKIQGAFEIHAFQTAPEKMAVFFTDITERKRAEEALRNKTEELDRYFNNSLDLLCIADNGGHFRRLNPEWEKVLGYPLEELEGRLFLDYVHPDDLGETLAAVARLAEQQEILNFVNRYRCKNGEYRWIEWRSYPQAKLIYAVARDITDRMSAEQQRLDMERRLLQAQKMESLGVLAGGIAHDFSNLLQAVLGNLEMAMEELPAMEPARSSISAAILAGRRAAELTRQMLDYSGKGGFLTAPTNLSRLIEENAHLWRTAVSSAIHLKFDLQKGLPDIQADVMQISQVVLNLITNASESFGNKKGVISLSTGACYYSEHDLSKSALGETAKAGPFVYLEVSDNGCGMDQETQNRLFEPFFSTKFTGRGLGMSAVSGIVRGHAGAIMLRSNVHVGTTIRILFPVDTKADIVETMAKAPASPATNNKELLELSGTVLIADDEEAVRSFCQRVLARMGLQLLMAEDGQEAVDLFREHADKIGCVILDLSMPKMDGLSTCSELRAIRPDVKVILASGHNEQDALAQFPAQGLSGFLQKPFRIKELQETVIHVLNS